MKRFYGTLGLGFTCGRNSSGALPCIRTERSADLWQIEAVSLRERNFITPPLEDPLREGVKLVNLAGAGGAGQVVFVKRKHSENVTLLAAKVVNLKRFSRKLRKKTEVVVVLQREVEILRRVSRNCRFIVNFVDAFFVRSLDFWLVTELCLPGDLTYLCQLHVSRFTAKEVAVILFCVVSALVHIHSFRIYHGDVKPQNLLVDRKEGLVKLCDFGTANWEVPGAKVEGLMGTLQYSPPETFHLWTSPVARRYHWIPRRLLRGSRKAYFTRKMDVWGAGLLPLTLLDRTPWFKAPDEEEFFDRIKSGLFKKFRDDPVDSNVVDFVNLCLRLDFRERPDADELMSCALLQSAKEEQASHQKILRECCSRFLP